MTSHAASASFFDSVPYAPEERVMHRAAKSRPTTRVEETSEGDGFDLVGCLRLVEHRDDRAAAALVAHLYPQVIRIVRRRVPDRIPEEDVAQEVFVKMFRKLGQYRGDVPFDHWVAKITVNACANAMRGQRFRLERRRADLTAAEEAALQDLQDVDREPNPGQLAASRDLLNRLLTHLDPRERVAVEMVELEGHSAKEAAGRLGCSAVALRVRLSRARAKLRRYLDELTDEGKGR